LFSLIALCTQDWLLYFILISNSRVKHSRLRAVHIGSSFAAPLRIGVQMCADGGDWSAAALEQLSAASYSAVVKLQGGYQGWQLVSSRAE